MSQKTNALVNCLAIHIRKESYMLRFMFFMGTMCATAAVFGDFIHGQESPKSETKEVHQLNLLQSEFARMTFVAFSEGGNQLIDVRGSEGRFWDWKTAKQVRTFRHDNSLRCAAISADGKWLAAGSNDKSVWVWEISTGKRIRTFDGLPGVVFRVNLSTDGSWLASACAGRHVLIWEVATGNLQTKIELDERDRGALEGVALVGNGKCVVTSAYGITRLWDVKTGKHLRLINGWFGGVSADGKSLLTFNGTSNRDLREIFLTRVWDVETGDEKQTVFGSDERPWSRLDTAILSPDGKQIVVVIDEHTIDKHTGDRLETIRFWEAATGKETRVLKVYGAQASELFMSNDSKLLCWRSRVGSLWEREKVIIMDVILW